MGEPNKDFSNKETKVSADDEAKKAEKEKKEAEKEKEKALKKRLKNADKEIEALKGKTCYDAKTLLKELGYTADYTFETNGADFTGEIDAMDTEQQKGFVVTSVDDVDKKDKKASFKINSKTNIDAAKKDKALRNKLSESSSCVAIENYGKSQYAYGFSFSSFSATFTRYDDNTWSVSGTCKITNGYGTKAEMQCIARVTGTSENPKVTYFEVR